MGKRKSGAGSESYGISLCEELIEAVAECLALHWAKRDIKKLITQVNGGNKPSPSTVEKIIRLAREMLATRAREILHTRGADERAINLYVECLKDPQASWSEKLKAQDEINAFLQMGKHKPVVVGERDPDAMAEQLRQTLASMEATVEDD